MCVTEVVIIMCGLNRFPKRHMNGNPTAFRTFKNSFSALNPNLRQGERALECACAYLVSLFLLRNGFCSPPLGKSDVSISVDFH